MEKICTKSSNFKAIEIIVFTMIWIGVFSIPFFQNRQLNITSWDKVLSEWIRIFLF